jgi:uncharacterized protein (TIGR01777 family)
MQRHSTLSGGNALNILVTGSSGLIGSELCAFFKKRDHRILRLLRRTPLGDEEIRWDPSAGKLDTSLIEGLDAVVHLAGENIAGGRWTASKRLRIRQSRVQGTRFLAQSLAGLLNPPKVLISVSAIGYYGDRGEERLDEESSPGEGFLPKVCKDWESATEAAAARGIRVVMPRIGMVLSAEGGALDLMLPIFRLGIGGKIGTGRQYMSWIAIGDLIGIINHVIYHESLRGPVNAVSPNPETNVAFARTLGRVLSRPAVFALPAVAARCAFGQMADELLLSSARVVPAKLLHSGYAYQFPELEGALRHILQKPVSRT